MEVNIIDGPYCDENTIFWKIRTDDKEIYGFYPEGNGNSYWMIPSAPTQVTPDIMGGVKLSGVLKLHMSYKCNGR